MGRELTCDARVDGKKAHGKALLETDELLLRGETRVRIRRRDVKKVTVRAGVLRVEHAGGVLELVLGDAAEKWAAVLTEPPKSRIDKLGVKPGAKVSILGVDDEAFVEELAERGADVAFGRAKPGSTHVFLAIESDKDLRRIAVQKQVLAHDGALWLLWRKPDPAAKGVAKGAKKAARPGETDVIAAGRAAGLTDTKVVRFSDTHGALRFVPRKK